jgi:hypothetical protein
MHACHPKLQFCVGPRLSREPQDRYGWEVNIKSLAGGLTRLDQVASASGSRASFYVGISYSFVTAGCLPSI